ncbi:phage baseplate assembly protein V [Aeromonas veronii]|uniref:phage baseplate assembly protein V n=1 Tax=Aeromonas veronii TaxID=654 RepID=UPI0024438FE3|nr:phage baseplate assembly protein V [Aeromonas veronii]
MNIIELLSKIDDLIRIGTVTEVRSGECRVETKGNHTNWRPYLVLRAGRTRRRMRPSVGEQVILLSLGGDLRNAFVLAGIYQDEHPEPQADDDNGDLDRTEYPDGAVIEYNPTTGELTAEGIKTAAITASVTVKLITPLVECTKALKVGTTISAGGKITAPLAKIGDVEVTTHVHDKVLPGEEKSGGAGMNWLGMNAANGRTVSETAHILQSVRDILTTPIGTRVMRRDYGSEIFSLIDQPQHGATRLRLMAATVHALTLWEPRIRITKVEIGAPELGGGCAVTLTWRRADNGLLESGTVQLPTGATS